MLDRLSIQGIFLRFRTEVAVHWGPKYHESPRCGHNTSPLEAIARDRVACDHAVIATCVGERELSPIEFVTELDALVSKEVWQIGGAAAGHPGIRAG